ncbi:hypothetical protein OJAV_G00133520 [Oryzias javanicus]|uniref:Uncharacterized protein n=1 Tax=Oryzias javanicus TaxID=123683 RepID=A0A3S2PZ68_ORYJA|nr:hypothetical protein OJAV_G00133520 [Oryzias javanicus]
MQSRFHAGENTFSNRVVTERRTFSVAEHPLSKLCKGRRNLGFLLFHLTCLEKQVSFTKRDLFVDVLAPKDQAPSGGHYGELGDILEPGIPGGLIHLPTFLTLLCPLRTPPLL